MATINVYEQYCAADCTYNGVKRKAALVALVSDSDAGMITYKALVTFFPHRNEEDYAISYDACFEKELYHAAGRRSKKREKEFLESGVFKEEINKLASEHKGKVLWDKPLREARV